MCISIQREEKDLTMLMNQMATRLPKKLSKLDVTSYKNLNPDEFNTSKKIIRILLEKLKISKYDIFDQS